MSKVRGRSLNSNAIHFQVIINETLCHGQHLRDRIRAACGCLFSTGFLCSMSALALGDHLKTGHRLSLQNRPTGLAEDVIVLPCLSVFGQGVV